MKKPTKPMSIALGTALVSSLGAAGVANAGSDADLFVMDELSNGYLIAGNHIGTRSETGEERSQNGQERSEEKGDNRNDGNKGGNSGENSQKSDEGEGRCGGSGA